MTLTTRDPFPPETRGSAWTECVAYYRNLIAEEDNDERTARVAGACDQNNGDGWKFRFPDGTTTPNSTDEGWIEVVHCIHAQPVPATAPPIERTAP